MKNLSLLLLLFFILPFKIYGQWIQQNTGTTSALYDIEFQNDNTGWAVGDGGRLLKTTNAGGNWIPVTHPAAGKPLSALSLIGPNTIYFVGWFETIIKSTNSGQSWIVIRNGASGQGSSYDACHFINENTGWICGSGQKVLRTTNGGMTIDSAFLNVGYISDIYFKNDLEGVLSGETNILYKTTNGGINWFNSIIQLPTNQPGFRNLCFINDLTGWTPGGDGRIFKTTNFGTSWDSISDLNTSPDGLYCIEFVDSLTGWTGGEGGKLYKSTNGGRNWIREDISIGVSFIHRLHFYNDSIGWTVGGQGKIFHTTTGGQSVVGIVPLAETTPEDFLLHQNFPNPFNNSTIIQYEVMKRGIYSLEIFDISGMKVDEINMGLQSIGTFQVSYTAQNLASGVYFYKLIGAKKSIAKKFLLIK